MNPILPNDRPPPSPNLLEAFAVAIDGVLRTLVDERNMKIHWVSAMAVMLVGMALALDSGARTPLLFSVILVLVLEALNAAVEGMVDLATASWAFAAKRAKDAAAGAVLLAAVGSAVILGDVLYHHWRVVAESTPAILRTVLLGLPLLAAAGTLLTAPRTARWMVGSGLILGVAWGILAAYAQDPVFAIACAGLGLGAAVARYREPHLLKRSPPGED